MCNCVYFKKEIRSVENICHWGISMVWIWEPKHNSSMLVCAKGGSLLPGSSDFYPTLRLALSCAAQHILQALYKNIRWNMHMVCARHFQEYWYEYT